MGPTHMVFQIVPMHVSPQAMGSEHPCTGTLSATLQGSQVAVLDSVVLVSLVVESDDVAEKVLVCLAVQKSHSKSHQPANMQVKQKRLAQTSLGQGSLLSSNNSSNSFR